MHQRPHPPLLPPNQPSLHQCVKRRPVFFFFLLINIHIISSLISNLKQILLFKIKFYLKSFNVYASKRNDYFEMSFFFFF